jgi:hypothetical protein
MGIQTKNTEKGTRQYCIQGRERTVQKRAQEILDNLHERFTAVSLDESFFFFDSIVRKVWIEENSRPIITLTGSHRHFCIFGAISLDRKQLFRQYDRFDENTFYEFLKQLHYKFPKCYLFLDKASQHYKSHKVRQYFEQHRLSNINSLTYTPR